MRPNKISEVPPNVLLNGKKLNPTEVLEKIREGFELVEKVVTLSKQGKNIFQSIVSFFSSIFGGSEEVKTEKVYELKKVAK